MAEDITVYKSIHTGTAIDALLATCGDVANSLTLLNTTTEKVNNHEAYIEQHKRDYQDVRTILNDKASLSNGNVFSCQLQKFVDCEVNESPNKSLIKINNNTRIPKIYAPVYSCAVEEGDITAGVQPYSHNNKNGYQFSWYLVKKDKTISNLARITDKGQVFGAVWNDFAEFRNSTETEPGRVICENGDGTLSLSHKRCQPGAMIISDTYGFAIGQTDSCQTPVAVSGRVLAHTYEDWWTFEPGEPVCSGPNGTVSKMSRREVRKYPERIIGTVSELPTYETWGENNVEINGRIWIHIK